MIKKIISFRQEQIAELMSLKKTQGSITEQVRKAVDLYLKIQKRLLVSKSPTK